MEGNLNHGYIPEDMGYDDLINNAGWPGAANPYPYQQQAHPAQDPYSQYTTSQPSFDQYDLSHQTSYTPVTYSNSPYVSQYQHARPSDVFGPTSFNVDPSLQSSATYHGTETSFSFAPPATETRTISPQNLQYAMSSNQPMNRSVSNSPFQRQAGGVVNNFSHTLHQQPQDHAALYFDSQNDTMQRGQTNSVQYLTFPNGTPDIESKQGVKRSFEGEPSSNAPRPQPVKLAPPPNPLRVTHPALLAAKDSSSRPRFDYAPYVAWEDEPIQVAPGLKNTLPKYHPRKSRSGRELIPGFDLTGTLTPARISTKVGRPPKPAKIKPVSSKWKGTSLGPRPVSSKINALRDDENLAGAKSPSTATESSSSEEESTSEEESEYDEDEDMPKMDISEVRGATRPTDVAAAAGWDATGIIWKDPNSSPNGDVVKDAIEKYGNFVSALRVQLKANATKIEEAASNPTEVNRLKAARKVQLEALFQTIDAANRLGYDAIVEHLGGHHKLVNGLTTTLIECIKADDFVGKLPKAVFSLLAKFQTMSDELLKKLKFDSIQKRWNKKGDEETKKHIVTILANTIDAKERAAKAKKDAEEKQKVEQTKARNSETVKTATPNPAKRPLETDRTNGKPNKKFASDVAGIPSSSTKPVPPKRPTNNLLGIASKPAAKLVVKKREPSPPAESKLGALLASIAKPPEPPKAPEAPSRPPETPEEKARRERKESRRHLRVKFKEGPELEQIRLFKHEQGEDEGRQDNMLRDAHDDHQEGMMHKKRVSEAMDDAMEEDEYQPPDFEERPYTEPISIDFSSLEKGTTYGQSYSTRGGQLEVRSPEQKTQERREGLELMAVYTDPKDIPPSPKEPHQFDGSGNVQQERQFKEPAEPWLVQRLQEINQYGPEQASQLFLRRSGEQLSREARESRARGIAQSFTPPSGNLSSILQQLGGPGQQPAAQLPQAQNFPYPQSNNQTTPVAMDQAELERLLRAVAPLVGKPFPATEPPHWMVNEAQRAGWWEGYNRDKAIKERQEADQRMAQMEAARFQPAPMLLPQIAAPSMQSYPPPPQQNASGMPQLPDITQQVQSLLAGYSGNSNGQHLAQFDFNSWAAVNNPVQGQDSAHQNQQPGWGGSWNNERNNENQRPKSDRSQENTKSKGKRKYDSKQWSDGPLDENGEYKGKKKPCRFYQEGKCAKGAKCTFLHD